VRFVAKINTGLVEVQNCINSVSHCSNLCSLYIVEETIRSEKRHPLKQHRSKERRE